MEIMSRAEARKRGLKRYFLGPDKPCPHGHIAERLTSNGTCVVCTRTKADKWAAEVSGTIKPCKYGHNAPRTANGACSECEKIRAEEAFAADPERVRDRSRRYYGNHTEERRADRREYGRNNREKETAAYRVWREANPELAKARDKRGHDRARERYHADPDYRAAVLAGKAAWDAANQDKVRAKNRRWHKNQYQTSLSHRLKCLVRNGVGHALKSGKKFSKSLEVIGCSVPVLIAYIEDQFRGGMEWANWGRKDVLGGWELDHCKAIGLHDLSDPAEFAAAFHYSNLQPLLIHEHRQKSKVDHALVRALRRRNSSSA